MGEELAFGQDSVCIPQFVASIPKRKQTFLSTNLASLMDFEGEQLYLSEEGNGNPLQYPCLENLMDRGAQWAAVHGVTNSQAQRSD